MPPPTSVPTTGADMSWMEQGKWTAPPVVVKKAAIANSIAAGEPTYLQIPSLQLTTVVEEMGWDRTIGANGEIYSQWDEIHFAAGWLENSALPGSDGNVVMTGHNNVFGAVFRDLWRMKNGEPIIIDADGERFVYVVDTVTIRPEWNATDAQRAETASYIAQTSDQRLTLVSCWPPNSNTHRVFVEAHLAPYQEFPLQMPIEWQSSAPQLSQ